MNEEIIKPGLVRRIVDKLDDTRIVVGGNKEFYKSLYHLQYTQEIVDNVISAFLDVVEDEVEGGNSIRLNGYLIIKPEFRKGRKARNVYANEDVMIPDRYVLKIKAGKRLKEANKRFNEKNRGDNGNDWVKR